MARKTISPSGARIANPHLKRPGSMAAIFKKLFFINEVQTHLNLLRKLVYRDFFTRFIGSAFGLVWAIINPLVLMGMYILLFSVILKIKIEGGSDHIDFGFFLFCGMIPWLSFQESLSKSSNIIIDFRMLIQQIKFPLSFLPLHIAISCAVQELITIALFFLLVLQFRDTQTTHILFLLLTFPLKFFLTVGFNLFLSSAAVFYRDIVQIIQIVLMCWFFSTPIVYPMERLPENLLVLAKLNPFTHIVNMYRYSIMSQGHWSWTGFFYTATFSMVIYLTGLIYFRKMSKKFTSFL